MTNLSLRCSVPKAMALVRSSVVRKEHRNISNTYKHIYIDTYTEIGLVRKQILRSTVHPETLWSIQALLYALAYSACHHLVLCTWCWHQQSQQHTIWWHTFQANPWYIAKPYGNETGHKVDTYIFHSRKTKTYSFVMRARPKMVIPHFAASKSSKMVLIPTASPLIPIKQRRK